ncbi:hypothetical protein A2U01_0014625 [Trifolium medium]|uniref:CCHC-type domain-containing protein n=1 Tax=Trifolium medium TaxID=97028 RepID=A0A392N262_9FABA|nr:hypothetical protein [Trifolium medium]
MFNQLSQHLVQQQSQHPAKPKNMKSDNMSHHHVQQGYFHPKSKQEPAKRCSHCGRYGHLQTECFKVYGYPQKVKSPRSNQKRIVESKTTHSKDYQIKKVWISKNTIPCMLAHTTLRKDENSKDGSYKHRTRKNKNINMKKRSKGKCHQKTSQIKSPHCLTVKEEEGKMSQTMVQHLYSPKESEAIQEKYEKGILGKCMLSDS